MLSELNDSYPTFNGIGRSPYYSVLEFNKTYCDDDRDLKLTHLNIRSLYPKLDEITGFLQTLNLQFDLICFSETWLSDTSIDLVDFSGYNPYHVVRGDGRRGGGVSIFVRKDLCCKLIDELCFCGESMECLFVDITKKDKRIIVGVMYRPPNCETDLFLSMLEDVIRTLSSVSCHSVYICGDFNYNLLNINSDSNCLDFVNMMFQYFYNPLITRPTRISETSCTLIDNIFSTCVSDNKSGIIPCDLSDHCLVFSIIHNLFSNQHQASTTFPFRLHNTDSLSNLCHAISEHDFTSVTQCNEVDQSISHFDNIIMHYYNHHCPVKTKTISYKNLSKPWVDAETRLKIKKRSNYYILFKMGKLSSIQFKRYRNLVTKEIRDKKKSYFEKKFLDYKSDMKRTWNLLNNLIKGGTANNKVNICLTDVNGNRVTDPISVANKFNEFFSSIGEQINTNFPDQPDGHREYLSGNFIGSFFVSPVSPICIHKIIMSLKSKPCNISCFPVFILKRISFVLSPILACLVNKSLLSGQFPQILKRTIVVPLHKGGAKDGVGNYRPISILPTYSKIYEKVMYIKLVNYFEVNCIFYEHQYGFRANKGTTQAMLNIVSDVYCSLDSGDLYFSMFLDLKKAFDSVSHDVLLSKLSHYGVRGTPLEWFRSYLTNRTQSVVIENVLSNDLEITCGVPQGSVLGGLLFLIFFNDFPNCTNFFKFTLFADDSTISLKFPRTSLHTIHNEINLNLSFITDWLQKNKILINPDKTKYTVFSYRDTYELGPIKIDGVEIEFEKVVNFLGLSLDNNLTFSNHIIKLSSKISRYIGILNKINHVIPENILSMFYNSFIHSNISYAIELWYNTSNVFTNKVHILQKKAVRSIKKAPHLEHTADMFTQLRILNIDNLFKLKTCNFLYKTINIDNFFPNLLDYICSHSGAHSYGTRNTLNITLPLFSRSRSQNSIYYIGCSLWNYVVESMKCSSNVGKFSKSYKKYLITQQ